MENGVTIMNYPKEFDELVNSFYEIERILNALEKKPRIYDTDVLLYSGETHTLKAIAENEGITQKELSELMYRTKGATSLMIDKLVKKGLVTKSPGRGDQRKTTLCLTEKGKHIHDDHLKLDNDRLTTWFQNTQIPHEQLVIANQVVKEYLKKYKETFIEQH